MKYMISRSAGLVLFLLICGTLLFEAQTFYGKRQTGFYRSKEDGAAFGYFVPPGFSEKNRYPLVVIFGKKATDVMTWKDWAVKDGFLVLAVQPKLGGEWNYSWDVDRTLRKIKEMKGWYPIDEKRIYAFGYEKGGIFALIMTINQPKTFAACAALDAKTAKALIAVSDRGSEREYLDVFAYTADKSRQRPLWLMNFSKSGFVSADEAAKTRALLGKYGYPAVYQSAEGESCALTQKMAGEIYAWFKSQGAA